MKEPEPIELGFLVEVTGMYTLDRMPTVGLVLDQTWHTNEWGGYTSYTVLIQNDLVEVHEVDVSRMRRIT
jgi:hypothetical protein